MDKYSCPGEKIDFFVGAEMRLKDVLDPSDVSYLLESLITAGADYTAVTDGDGAIFLSSGDSARNSPVLEKKALIHEGETIGYLLLSCSGSPGIKLPVLANIASFCLNTIIRSAAKRMLTAELHTTVVQQTYDELLGINKQLAESEKKYRDLALTLEQKVEERSVELKTAHIRLLQQEKMASIGQLAAGLAHEINNPIGFINSNLNTFLKYMSNINEMLQFYRESIKHLSSHAGEETPEEIRAAIEKSEGMFNKLKIGFIISDSSDLIRQSIAGAERIKKIVANLKGFSHIDETADRGIDINEELDNTLSVLSNEITVRSAKVIREYGQLQSVFGNPGLLCQVFLNLLLNALQSGEQGLIIKVTTEQKGDSVVVNITDNGRGIPAEILDRIFEPFFTTREVGKGTGMGLAVTYDIVNSYKGTIEARSGPGGGATFIITLPAKGAK